MGTKLKQKVQDMGGLNHLLDVFRGGRLSLSYTYKSKPDVMVHKRRVTGLALPVRFPWQKCERQEMIEKKAAVEKNPEAEVRGKLMRIKFPERHTPTTVGPGYPSRGLVYANLPIARGTQEREVLQRSNSGRPIMFTPLNTKIPQSISDETFKEYCSKLGIGVYEEEPPLEDPTKGLDLTTFDLYWEDIRIERDVLIRELRHMPLKSKVDLVYLGLFEKSMHHLARSCFYSPTYTHKRCEDVLHIFLWLLNRRNLPLVFHIKVLQCLSLLIYSSPLFKKELVNVGGVRILLKLMQLGMVYCGLQASWACYCLTVAAIGCPEVIAELKTVNDIDERVGEMSFHMFWYHWPTNFGMILQSILYGPGGVANSLDAFEFL